MWQLLTLVLPLHCRGVTVELFETYHINKNIDHRKNILKKLYLIQLGYIKSDISKETVTYIYIFNPYHIQNTFAYEALLKAVHLALSLRDLLQVILVSSFYFSRFVCRFWRLLLVS